MKRPFAHNCLSPDPRQKDPRRRSWNCVLFRPPKPEFNQASVMDCFLEIDALRTRVTTTRRAYREAATNAALSIKRRACQRACRSGLSGPERQFRSWIQELANDSWEH